MSCCFSSLHLLTAEKLLVELGQMRHHLREPRQSVKLSKLWSFLAT